MTNTIAVVIGLTVCGLVAADLSLTEGATLVFLGKKFLDLLHWMAFWR